MAMPKRTSDPSSPEPSAHGGRQGSRWSEPCVGGGESPAESLRSRPIGSTSIRSRLYAVSRMVSLISHDLRHPLTASWQMRNFSTQPDISEMERNESWTTKSDCAVDRMNESVYSAGALEGSGDTLRPGARNIVDTVGRAIRMTRVRQEFRGISIEHHHEGMAVGWFDSSCLERVVANLVLNACEAVSPDSGRLS